jgi:hypothetical protein
MPTRNVSLPEKLDQFITAKVESGDYANASEVMRTASAPAGKGRAGVRGEDDGVAGGNCRRGLPVEMPKRACLSGSMPT